ncbi:MAG: hypothetical protein R6V01_10620 [Thermoplasmatota archaeon]
MLDQARIRSAAGALLFLLVLALVSASLLTDEWYTTEGSEGSRKDTDSDWWHLEIEMGARRARSHLEMFDPDSPVVLEHYNNTEHIYQGDLGKGGEALEYSLIAAMIILPILAVMSILTYFRLVPGRINTSFTMMVLLLLLFGIYMFHSRIPDQTMDPFVPDDEKLQTLIGPDDLVGLSENLTPGSSTYLSIASSVLLIPNIFLFMGIKREKRPGPSTISKGFFKDHGERKGGIQEKVSNRVRDKRDEIRYNGDEKGTQAEGIKTGDRGVRGGRL